MKHILQRTAMVCWFTLIISACDSSTNGVTPLPTESTSTGSNSTEVSQNTENQSLNTASITAFQEKFKTEGKTYQGAIRMLFLALLELEKNPEEAQVMLSAVYNGKKLTADSSSPTGYSLGNSDRFIVDQMRQRPEIVRSYVGGTPEQNYTNFDAEAGNIVYPAHGTVIEGLKVNNTLDGNTEGQVYIQSLGKDFPTPIRLEQNNQGLFKIDPSSVSSIATGVKKPEPEDF